MADFQEESDSSDEIEDDGYQDSGEMSPTEQSTEYVPPLDRLYEYSISDNMYNRQMVGRSVVETLRVVHESPADVDRVMNIIERTAKDSEPAVRGEMMEHLPHIVMVCHELALPAWQSIVDYLLPIALSTITDPDNQVQKTAQTALLVLMEQNLISQPYIEEMLCPVIIGHTHLPPGNNGPDHRPSIIALMSKMAPLLGSEITEQLFVPRFTALCSDSSPAIRKTCASNFGDFCAVVNRQVTESELLIRFCELARDKEWEVRKACAEVIMSVSCACGLQTRKEVLADVFDSLLSDAMRWVRVSAFQTLGPFITTFAEPSITGLAYNQQGELVLTNPEGFEFRMVSQKPEYPSLEDLYEELGKEVRKVIVFKKQPQLVGDGQETVEDTSCATEDYNYNNFLYWRDPIPDVDVDLNIAALPTNSTASNSVENVKRLEDNVEKMEETREKIQEPLVADEIWEVNSMSPQLSEGSPPRSPNTHNDPEAELLRELRHTQDVVPQPLLDHFKSMAFGTSADIDMAHHCAFSLPAVALTLGPAHWEMLRETYTVLASDRQWKVRRTVASSIHELAVIVGEEVATKDLVPIFSGLIKDLDEVRIGALKHLAYFLRLLRPAGRNQFLPKLADFLKTEYDYNWRFREELASQLLQALCLFSPVDTCKHLTPVAISLLLDNVAAVRQTALYLVTELVNQVSNHTSLLRGLLAELAEQFAHSSRWNRRQTFALLCSRLATERVLSDDMFARDVLPHLLDLSWDPVPNVRLAVARTLAVHIMDNQYFCNEQNPHHEVLIQALKRLQSDKDRDVRYFAALRPKRVTAIHEEFQQVNFSST